MSDLEIYIKHLETQMESCRQGRITDPVSIAHKMINAQKQRNYRDLKNKRDTAKKFLDSFIDKSKTT